MSCRLCLKESADLFNIFHDEGKRLGVTEIIAKYFWFEVYEDDLISTYICAECWQQLNSFHIFYLDIEKKHSDDNIILKEEECQIFLTELEEVTQIKSEPDDPITKEEIVGAADELVTAASSESSFKAKPKLEDDSEDYSEDDSEDTLKEVKRKKRSNKVFRSKRIKTERTIDSKYADEEVALKNFCSMICDKCEEPFSEFTWAGALNHYNEKHKIAGYVFCCKRKYNEKSRIMQHISRHLNPAAFQCDICKKNYANKTILKKHIEHHKPEESRPFPCDECPRRFLKKYLLVIHSKTTHSKISFPCSKCDRVMGSNSSLQSHIKGVHENKFVHICEICAKTFRNKPNYENHKKVIHLEQPRPKLQCNICQAWVKNESSLRSHKRLHLDSNFVHACETCGKIAPNRAALQSHKRYVHLLKRSFACTFCEKAFKKPVEWREHMAGHTGEILYHCPAPGCSKSCNSNANMMAHKKKFHREFWEEEQRRKMM